MHDAWCMMRCESSNYKLGCLNKDSLFWNLCWDRQTDRRTDRPRYWLQDGRTIKTRLSTRVFQHDRYGPEMGENSSLLTSLPIICLNSDWLPLIPVKFSKSTYLDQSGWLDHVIKLADKIDNIKLMNFVFWMKIIYRLDLVYWTMLNVNLLMVTWWVEEGKIKANAVDPCDVLDNKITSTHITRALQGLLSWWF